MPNEEKWEIKEKIGGQPKPVYKNPWFIPFCCIAILIVISTVLSALLIIVGTRTFWLAFQETSKDMFTKLDSAIGVCIGLFSIVFGINNIILLFLFADYLDKRIGKKK